MITEVFVSLNGVDFNKLDLENDESIPMRYTFKDTQDIAKIFSPYSLNFTFNATPNNLLYLGYFGNTDVIKTTNLRKIKCKIYVNSILNQFGLLKLEKITYKMGKPSVITASFATNMTSLKDKIGNDTIDLLSSKSVEWIPRNIKQSLESITTLDVEGVPLKWFIPLASTNRVWGYNNNTGVPLLDNICFDTNSSPISNNVIKGKELRPAITFSTIVELIKKKYGLLIVSPLENRSEYKDAYVWCMGKDISNQNLVTKFVLKNNLGSLQSFGTGIASTPMPRKYTVTSSTANNSFKVVRNSNVLGWTIFIGFKISFENIYFLGEGQQSVTISLNKIGQTETFLTETFDAYEGTTDIELQLKDDLLTSNQLEFQVNVQFNIPCIWSNSKVTFYYSYSKINLFVPSLNVFSSFIYSSTLNNNNIEMGGSKIDLIKSLPEIKVIDFLTSYFKAFNIAVLDISPDDDSLYWFTPQDILQNKKEVTYTADISDVEKTTQDDYNYYIFKHAESSFRSNVDYKIGAKKEYAQTNYPELKPNDAKEFKVETNFTLIPPVTIVGTEIPTFYGFESGQPDILDTGESRYNPNFGELPIFYSHGNTYLGLDIGVQSSLLNGNLITQSISSYIKTLPYTTDLKSFAWSVIVFNNLALRDNLFSRYYLEIIKRYIDQNVMKQEFSLTLSTNEVRYFKLENDIIIGENKFSIIDSTIDITTGKTKLTLLNY